MRLARPAILMAGIAAVLLFLITTWITPLSLSHMENLRAEIKAQYSTLLFREGVFNPVGDGLIIYVRERTPDGELHGLMIHDTRQPKQPPITIVARRGTLVSTRNGQQVLVYDGSRQSINPSNGTLNQLDFDRYTIDLPEGSGPVPQRWREPEERTLMELLYPDPKEAGDPGIRRDFLVEFHRRLISPLLAPAFTLIALALLLVGPVDRRGQGWRIALAVAATVLIEGLYLSVFNLARRFDAGLVGMYALILLPIAISLFCLDARSEPFRQSLSRKTPPAGVLP
jgi:lipopolysaccharide export system permease protein